MSSALPPIDQSLVPTGVRAQGKAAVQKYEAALSFEGMLDEQLAQSLTQSLQDTSSADGSSDGGGDATSSLMLQMLPQTLAQGLVSDGGLGLAPELYTAMGGTLTPPAKNGSGS